MGMHMHIHAHLYLHGFWLKSTGMCIRMQTIPELLIWTNTLKLTVTRLEHRNAISFASSNAHNNISLSLTTLSRYKYTITHAILCNVLSYQELKLNYLSLPHLQSHSRLVVMTICWKQCLNSLFSRFIQDASDHGTSFTNHEMWHTPP